MRIAFVSPGAVGGYFAALLARSGEDVVALARGEHLKAIQEKGIRVTTSNEEFVTPLHVSCDARELGVVDVVVFAVKVFQIESAVKAAKPLLGPHTVGISLLNGVQGPELISKIIPENLILGGSAYVSAVIAAPGHIRLKGEMSSLAISQPTLNSSEHSKVADFAERCNRAGFRVDLSNDVSGILWSKLIGLSTHSALTASSRRPSGDLYTDPEILEVTKLLLAEAAAVARANGIKLSENLEDEWIQRFKSFPADSYASMYHDLIKGNRLEVDAFSGYIYREGARLGIPTPHHAALYSVLKPHKNGQDNQHDQNSTHAK